MAGKLDKVEEAPKAGAAFVIEHTMVGLHAAGDVVFWTEDQIKKGGFDIERLLRLKAVRPATDEEAKGAVEYGKDSEITPLFPPVPADPNAAAHQEVPQKPAPEEVK